MPIEAAESTNPSSRAPLTRVPPIEREQAPAESRPIVDQQLAAHGRMTNMKKTLAHSPPALKALMEWYPLKDEVEPFLGPRRTILFAHAVSSATDCLICSTFFRRILIDAGEDVEHLALDPLDELVVEYGRQLAKDAHQVDHDLFHRLRTRFDHRQIVALTAFGALMLATNIFNNALRIELDEYLAPYRRADRQPTVSKASELDS